MTSPLLPPKRIAVGLAAGFAALLAIPHAAALNFVVIDTEQVVPSVLVPANDVLQVFPPGRLDTGTGGSVRSIQVLGVFINDADTRVGFSSESSGLAVGSDGEVRNRVVFGVPVRLQAAQGEIVGTLRNEGATLVTGSYPDAGGTFASPPLGRFDVWGVVENQTITVGPNLPGSGTTHVGTWTNHGDLHIVGRVHNSGLFESVNAPMVIAVSPSLPYAQRITLGSASFDQGARFYNEASGVVELREGTTFANAAEFANHTGAVVRVRQGAVLETAGVYSSTASMIAGRYEQQSGATTEVDGGVLRTRDRGAIFNGGDLLLSGNGLLDNGNYVLNRAGGSVHVGSDARITQGGGGLFGGLFENEGRLEVHGTMTGGELTTTGRLIIAAGGAIETNLISIEGGHVTVDGRIGSDTAASPVSPVAVSMTDSQLDGTGSINGDLFLSGSGPAFDGPCSSAPSGVACFAPGNSPGAMEIGGMLTMGAGSVLELEITRDASGDLLFDTVTAKGIRLEEGSLIRVVLDPSVGMSTTPLTLLTCTDASAECSFLGDVSVVGGSAGFEFLASGFSITKVSAIPEPSAFALTLVGLGALGAGIRRRQAARAVA